MAGDACYTLLASLPHLPHFTRARHLPITRERLDRRLGMLDADARAITERARTVLACHRPDPGITDAAMQARYRELIAEAPSRTLVAVAEFRMSMLTIMAALRRRRRGEGPPAAGEIWGAGPWVRRIEQNWSDNHLGLSAAQPWVARAYQLLESGDEASLERYLMDTLWHRLDRLAEEDPSVHPFGLDALLVYLFKWCILEHWLMHSAAQARDHFIDLVSEATRDVTPFFESA